MKKPGRPKARKPKQRWAQLTPEECKRIDDIGQPWEPKFTRTWRDHNGSIWAPADEVRAARSQAKPSIEPK